MAIFGMAFVIALLMWLQRRIYIRYWHRKLDMKLSFSAREAFEGDTLTLYEELTNAKPLPLPWVTAKFQMSRNLRFTESQGTSVTDEYNQNDMFSVNMYQRITRKQDVICSKRGFYRIKGMDLVSSNIFISDRLVKRLECDAELTVFPRLVVFEELNIEFTKLYGDIELRRFTNPDPFAFRGIREYQPGDAFRSLNFKATAKAGQLMVNLNSSTASQDLLILLNVQPYGVWYDENVVEDCIRIAASAAERFTGMGLSVGLISNGLDIASGTPIHVLPGSGGAHFNNILNRLARIDLSAGFEPMSGIMNELTDSDTVYLLVSCYKGEDIADSFADMLSAGKTARWIIPAPADDTSDIEENGFITVMKGRAEPL